MRYDTDAAATALAIEIATSVEPQLNSAEIAHCLAAAEVCDVDGLYPGDDDYTPTYTKLSLNAAYARGMRIKAAKLGEAANYTNTEGESFDPQIRRQFFIDAAKDYEAKARSVATVRTNRYQGDASILGRAIVN